MRASVVCQSAAKNVLDVKPLATSGYDAMGDVARRFGESDNAAAACPGGTGPVVSRNAQIEARRDRKKIPVFPLLALCASTFEAQSQLNG